jgi:hypothetical protein
MTRMYIFPHNDGYTDVVETPDHITKQDILFEEYETVKNMGCSIWIVRQEDNLVVKPEDIIRCEVKKT